MLATRCKLRWPGAVATVSSPSRTLVRCMGTTTTTTTTAHPEEADRDGDENRTPHDGSFRVVLYSPKGLRSPYIPRAYEPEPMTYLDLIARATSHPRHKTRRAVAGPRKELQTDQHFQAVAAGATPVRPAEPSPSFEYVLDRALHLLEGASEQLRPILSAVSQDVSDRLVPRGYTHDPATLRSHHLGRWYAGWLWLRYEHRQIDHYLQGVAANTEKARRYIASSFVRHAHAALRAQKDATRRAVEGCRGELEAAAYAMALELKVARRAGEWRRVWALERQLASTATMFLPSAPLASVFKPLRKGCDRRMAEISMARMAGWDDSYEALYAEDMEIRRGMNLVQWYRKIFYRKKYEKPWRGESSVFTLRSPTGTESEYVVLRLDEKSPPSPLWPRGWGPLVGTETRAGSDPGEAPDKTEQRTTNTPPGTGRMRILKIKGVHKEPKRQSQDKPSLETHANSDVPEAWYGSLLSDNPS